MTSSVSNFVCVPLWGTLGTLPSFVLLLFSQSEIMGTSLTGTGALSWGVWCGVGFPRFSEGTSTTEISLPVSNHHTWVWGPAHFSSPPLLPVSKWHLLCVLSYWTSVQLSSVDSQGWIFCSLVVIWSGPERMEADFYLLCHLDWKFTAAFLVFMWFWGYIQFLIVNFPHETINSIKTGAFSCFYSICSTHIRGWKVFVE